jgi:hypothetical protein
MSRPSPEYFTGVVEEIGDGLRDRALIERQRREPGVGLERHAESLGPDPLGEVLAGLADDARQVVGLESEGLPVRFDTGEVQHVLDELHQPPALVLDPRAVLLDLALVLDSAEAEQLANTRIEESGVRSSCETLESSSVSRRESRTSCAAVRSAIAIPPTRTAVRMTESVTFNAKIQRAQASVVEADRPTPPEPGSNAVTSASLASAKESR